MPICDSLIISPESNGTELLTIYNTELLGCRDDDGIILEYKYVYYKSLEDINDLEYKSNPLTEYSLSSRTFIILPSGNIYL